MVMDLFSFFRYFCYRLSNYVEGYDSDIYHNVFWKKMYNYHV